MLLAQMQFDNAGDLDTALRSQARRLARDDFHRFPPFDGEVTHEAMTAKSYSKRGRGRQIEGRAIFSQQIVNGLMLGSIYAMVGVALTLSIGVLKFLNFSIPGLFMIGGMSTWVFIRHRHAVAARRGSARSRSAPPLRLWSSASPGAGCATPRSSCRW